MKKLACFILLVCFSLSQLEAAPLPLAVSPLKLLLASICLLGVVTGGGVAYHYYKNKQKQLEKANKDDSDVLQINSYLAGEKNKRLKPAEETLEKVLSEQDTLDQKELASDAYQSTDDPDDENSNDDLLREIKEANRELLDSMSQTYQEKDTLLNDRDEKTSKHLISSEGIDENQAEEVKQQPPKAEETDPHALSVIHLNEEDDQKRKLTIKRDKQLLSNIRKYAIKTWELDDCEKKIYRYKTEIIQFRAAIEKTKSKIKWNDDKQERSLDQNVDFEDKINKYEQLLIDKEDSYVDEIDEDSPRSIAYRERKEEKNRYSHLKFVSDTLIGKRYELIRYLEGLNVKRREQGRQAESMLEKVEPEFTEKQKELREIEGILTHLNTGSDQWLEEQKQKILAQTKPKKTKKYKPDAPYEYNYLTRFYNYYINFAWDKI